MKGNSISIDSHQTTDKLYGGYTYERNRSYSERGIRVMLEIMYTFKN